MKGVVGGGKVILQRMRFTAHILLGDVPILGVMRLEKNFYIAGMKPFRYMMIIQNRLKNTTSNPLRHVLKTFKIRMEF